MREERVISIKSLLLASCKNWPRLVACGIIFALLGGGFQAYRSWPSTQESAVEEIEVDEDIVEPGSADYDQNAEIMQEQIEIKSKYLNESILAQIDPFQEGRAVVDMVVSTDALEEQLRSNSATTAQDILEDTSNDETTTVLPVTEAEEDTVEILRAYTQYLSYGMDWSGLPEEYQASQQYLSELVTVTQLERSKPSISIVVIYPDVQGAEEILNYIVTQMTNRKTQMDTEYGEHSVTFANQTANVVVDSNMFRWITDRTNELNNLITAKDNFTTATSALGYTAQTNTNTTVSKRSLLKPILKYTIAGGIGGIMLYLVCSMMILLMKGIVVDGKEMNRAYGFRKIAVIPTEKTTRMGRVDRLIQQGTLSYLSSYNREECYQIASDAVSALSGQGDVVLCGNLKPAELEQLAQSLHVKSSGDLSTAEDIKRLGKATSVIIGAKCGESSYGQIDRIMEIVDNYRIEVLGSIIIV